MLLRSDNGGDEQGPVQTIREHRGNDIHGGPDHPVKRLSKKIVWRPWAFDAVLHFTIEVPFPKPNTLGHDHRERCEDLSDEAPFGFGASLPGDFDFLNSSEIICPAVVV